MENKVENLFQTFYTFLPSIIGKYFDAYNQKKIIQIGLNIL